MRRKCRSVGSFVQTLNPPRLSGSAPLLVGRLTADGSYTVLLTTSRVHVTEAGKVLSTLLPLAAALDVYKRQQLHRCRVAPSFPGGCGHLFPDLGHGLPHFFQRFCCHVAQSSSV